MPDREPTLDEIEAALEAATGTEWHWSGQKNTHVGPVLSTWMPGHGRVTVMDFVRLGMRSAQPRFNIDGLMQNGNDLAVPEVDYRDDIASVDHPDAHLISHAPTWLAYLCTRVREAEAGLDQALDDEAHAARCWKAAKARVTALEDALRECDEAFSGWSYGDVFDRVERVRLISRALLPGPSQKPEGA